MKYILSILLVLIVVLSPLSGLPLDINAAHAASCAAGQQQVGVDADGNPQCQFLGGTVVTTASPTICTGTWNIGAIFNPICWGRTIGAVVDGLLVSIASWLLTLAGVLFNWLVTNTVIQFGSVYTDLKPAVEGAWTAFRDIANILMIGMFTFIAISIILGLKEYGQKKLIARVLIIAVLINFSLLFSKMIVDASNFVALQIYTAATGQTVDTATGNTGAVNFAGFCKEGMTNSQCYGISGAFMDYMGVSGFRDTKNAVLNLGDKIDNGNIAFLHGFFVSAVLLGAAIVLFYGSFLLASRVILIVLLFVTASVAFASYLIPAWETSSYGWEKWWSSLIKTALFAPILMLFLWVTLTVGYAMKGKGGTLGDLLADPTKGADIQSLFNYFVILGLLFVSFKLSSTFSEKIAGFNIASILAASPFTLGARAAGLALRLGVGAPAYFAGKAIMDSARADRNKAAEARRLQEAALNRGHTFSAGRFGKLASTLEGRAAEKAGQAAWKEKLAGSRFNVMDTSLAKSAMKGLGISGLAAGESGKTFLEKSYADQVKTRAEAGEKIAAKLAPGKGDEEKARTQLRDQREARRESLRLAEEQTKQLERLPERLAAAQRDLQGANETASRNRLAAEDDHRAGLINTTQHGIILQQETDRIANANKMVELLQSRVEETERPRKDHEKETKDIGDKLVAGMGKSAEEIAGKIGAKQGDALKRLYGSLPLPKTQNQAVRDAVVDKYKSSRDTAKWRKVFENMRDETQPPPATP